MSKEAFEALTLEEKMAFLQMAVEDRQQETGGGEGGGGETDTILGIPSTYATIGAAVLIAVPVVYFLIKKKD